MDSLLECTSDKTYGAIEYFNNYSPPPMQYLAAYLLASLSGKDQPTEADLAKILAATGQKTNDAEVKAVIEKLKGKKIEDLIKNGLGKVGSVGGGSAAPSGDAKKGGDKKEEKKEDKKKEEKKAPEPAPKEEEDFGLGGDLFGDF